MKKIFCISMLALVVSTASISAEQNETFLATNHDFEKIVDSNREADTWATCAASLEILSIVIQEHSPAQSKKMKQLSNGALVSAGMSLIVDELDQDLSPERFAELWNYSRQQMQSLYDVQQTSILAELEMSQTESQKNSFLTKVSNTVAVCSQNSDLQRLYVDMTREVAKSGMLN